MLILSQRTADGFWRGSLRWFDVSPRISVVIAGVATCTGTFFCRSSNSTAAKCNLLGSNITPYNDDTAIGIVRAAATAALAWLQPSMPATWRIYPKRVVD
jgi:hypothetical protein